MSTALIITAGGVTFHPESLTLHNLTHSLSPKTALIQQFKLFQLILKEEPQKRDQQLKRNKKGRNTDRGYNSTTLKGKADLKNTQSESKEKNMTEIKQDFYVCLVCI